MMPNATGTGSRRAMRGLLTLVAALLALSWMPLRAAAGSLSGTVSNPAGAALPGATVLLQNLATKEILTAVTNGNGFYAFSALPDGAYELRIEQRNFRPYAKDGVLLAPGAALKMDIRLEPESESATGSAPPRPFTSALLTTKGGFLTGISRRDTLLGDAWGIRRGLSRLGISLAVLETSEALGNLSGGVKRGAAYDGLTQVFLQLDTQRAFRWHGGTFNVSALQIHGSNLSENTLYSLQTASGIQADRATRLWELWYGQKFGETGRFDIKIGQQSLDQEFMVSQNALVFVNTMFGWAMLPSADMPGGGPAYPLSALGVRGRVRVANSWTLVAGVFNGRPWSGAGDAQEENSSGTSFPLNGGVLAIAELQYSYPSVGTLVRGNRKTPLPRVYKFGVWHDTAKFDDQRFDNAGISLADPASAGAPRTHKGDTAFYAVADQMIWQHADEADRSVNVFARAMATPQSDRNLIAFSLNAGLNFNEPIWHRDDDVFGIGMGYTRVGSRAAGLDRDTRVWGNPLYPIRGGEAFLEATYRYQFKTWWQWQPTFQYVFSPGAGIVNPNSPSGNRVKGEAVIGLRMNFAF
jgi:porin